VAGEYAIDAYVGGLPVGNSGVLLKVSPAPTDPARTALSAALGNGTLPSPLPVTAGTQAYVFLRSVDQVRPRPHISPPSKEVLGLVHVIAPLRTQLSNPDLQLTSLNPTATPTSTPNLAHNPSAKTNSYYI
jgi:hypothetical protein